MKLRAVTDTAVFTGEYFDTDMNISVNTVIEVSNVDDTFGPEAVEADYNGQRIAFDSRTFEEVK